MKKYFWIIFAVLVITSCDDGDLIVTTFEFEDNNIQTCTGRENRQVFFKLNNELSHEAIALVFTHEQPENSDFLFEDLEDSLTIPLDAQNQVIYRTFDGEVNASYFCNEIPPTSPNVLEEYRSTSGGSIIIGSQRRNLNDHDQDGIPTSVEKAVDASLTDDPHTDEEFPDSDGDTIPDYLDIDDDNDNVLTSYEITVEAESTVNDLPDTDGDGIPDYRDTDDDNDEVLTRYEVASESQNPNNNVNDDGIPNYLNAEENAEFPLDPSVVRENSIPLSYRYTVNLRGVTLQNQGGDGESITLQSYDFGIFDSTTSEITYPLEDEDDENDEGEEGEEEEGETGE